MKRFENMTKANSVDPEKVRFYAEDDMGQYWIDVNIKTRRYVDGTFDVGTLNVFLAGTNVGKSLMIIDAEV